MRKGVVTVVLPIYNVEKYLDRCVKSVFGSLHFGRWYSMYKNRICRNYRDGKVTKEELDKCSTCNVNCEINNGLSEASMEQMKNET